MEDSDKLKKKIIDNDIDYMDISRKARRMQSLSKPTGLSYRNLMNFSKGVVNISAKALKNLAIVVEKIIKEKK